ncbi:acyltransferase family protein [Apibacter sp. HY039]|uniref:acyltransferase family protein n=1 Tax=Apibacter sp. HY039 TaxID=2501476 RepID=UPI000FEBD3D7|nr:acyltransferase family protein [Apibacter sp. HY039]
MPKQRDSFFDSIKFILIFLVVLGHLLEAVAGINHLNRVAFDFIYTFHMPLFIFISGYFSKNITWNKFVKSFKSLFSTYVVFQFLFILFQFFFSGKFDWFKFIFFPQSVLWYIAGLMIWRFLFYFIEKFKISFILVFTISLVITFALGFTKDVIPFSRILTFFPYFILGYFCSEKFIKKIRSINKIYFTTFLILFFLALYFTTSNLYRYNLFGESTYNAYPTILEGIVYRGVWFLITIIVSIAFINVMPVVLPNLGLNTMEIYLLHPLFVYYVFNIIVGYYHLNPPFILVFLSAVLIVIICLYLGKLKFIKYLINPMDLWKKRS